MDEERLEQLFRYHHSNGVIVSSCDEVRTLYLETSKKLNKIITDGIDKEKAIEKLQESLYWSLRALVEEDIQRQKVIKVIIENKET